LTNGRFGIFRNILFDLLAVVIIVGEGIIDLGHCEMRKLCYEFFRCKTVVKDIKNHGPYRKASALNDGTPSANLRITGNMGM
jgi:hypothetical protein